MNLQLAEVERSHGAESLPVNASLVKPLRNAWRNRILYELQLRPLSPKRFSEEFGEVKLATVARYFRELKEWGFLEVAEEVRGGRRRGAVEKIYRAIRRVHFDTSTWQLLPDYLRRECSGIALESFVLRAAEAVQAGTLNNSQDRHLFKKEIVLDRPAWEALVSRLDETLEWVARLEMESGSRMATTGERPQHLTVALMAFPSSRRDKVKKQFVEPCRPRVGPPGPHFLLNPLTAKALADPWRSHILAELYRRPLSPRRFGEECGGPDLATIGRYFRQLKEWGYLEVAEELRGGHRRGAVEKMYRGVRRLDFNPALWRAVPLRLRREGAGLFMNEVIASIEKAVTADTLDSEVNRHTSWVSLWLDRQGWQECLNQLNETRVWIKELEVEAADRLANFDEEAIPVTASLLGFRSPGAFPWIDMGTPIGCTMEIPLFRAAA